MIEFLEGVLSSLRRRNFLDERDDGRRSLERFSERWNEKVAAGPFCAVTTETRLVTRA
jgi:hypothetical protein